MYLDHSIKKGFSKAIWRNHVSHRLIWLVSEMEKHLAVCTPSCYRAMAAALYKESGLPAGDFEHLVGLACLNANTPEGKPRKNIIAILNTLR